MKLQWHDGGMKFRPTSIREHNALVRLYQAMGAENVDSELFISPEETGRASKDTGNPLADPEPTYWGEK